MYSAILVPLDGSTFGERAIPIAVAIARRSAAALELIHVREPAARAPGAPTPDIRWEDESEQQVHARVSALAESLARETGLMVKGICLRDETAPALQEYAAARATNLVVMTTHDRGGFSRAWLGSVADELVRRATTPLLLIRPDAESTPGTSEPLFSRVFVPLDESPRAEEVLTHAAALGTPGHTVFLLLTVITARAALDPFPDLAGMLDSADLRRYMEEQQARARQYLAGVADSLREIGAQATTHTTVHRQPAAGILAFAREHAVDLIALSTRVRSATERILVGSVADKVVRGATVPLLLCGPRLEVTTSPRREAASAISTDVDPSAVTR